MNKNNFYIPIAFTAESTNQYGMEKKRQSQNERAQERRMARDFTDKEKKVMRLVCQQKNTKEIAEILGQSVRTIETDRQYIIKKIGCKNMVGVVFYALENGIYSIE